MPAHNLLAPKISDSNMLARPGLNRFRQELTTTSTHMNLMLSCCTDCQSAFFPHHAWPENTEAVKEQDSQFGHAKDQRVKTL